MRFEEKRFEGARFWRRILGILIYKEVLGEGGQ
jgi:hypothetical protein